MVLIFRMNQVGRPREEELSWRRRDYVWFRCRWGPWSCRRRRPDSGADRRRPIGCDRMDGGWTRTWRRCARAAPARPECTNAACGIVACRTDLGRRWPPRPAPPGPWAPGIFGASSNSPPERQSRKCYTSRFFTSLVFSAQQSVNSFFYLFDKDVCIFNQRNHFKQICFDCHSCFWFVPISIKVAAPGGKFRTLIHLMPSFVLVDALFC